MIKKMFNKEKGSITLYTLLACLFLTFLLSTIYIRMLNKLQIQEEEINQIQENYYKNPDVELTEATIQGLKINMNVNTFLVGDPTTSDSVNNTPITFSIKASKNGKVTYDNVVSINVSAAGTYTKTIDELKEPGTQVTVNAIYTGTNKLNTPAVQNIVIGNAENVVNYSLDYNGKVFSTQYYNYK